MQMVFYYHVIYSPETDNQGGTWVTFTMKQGLLFDKCHILCA
jgi:hypothetical protein